VSDRAQGERQRGRIERVLARVYARLGARVFWVAFVVGISLGIAAMAVTAVLGGRYLELSASQVLSVVVIWAPVAVLAAASGVLVSLRQVRTMLSWANPSDRHDRASDVWSAVVANRRIVFRAVAAIALFAIPPAAVFIISRYHKPWWSLFPFVAALANALASVGMLVAFLNDLILRPMLEDVASYLPADFEPQTPGIGLGVKALAPLPVVTGFSAILVGAYANASNDQVVRLGIAVAVTLVTVAVATVIFLIINRSVLSPIDELAAATERVRAGDISTPVPVVTNDELGGLAIGFNRMLADLRGHTEALRASRERIATAADEERRRVERDLHDGAQQQLVLAQLKLGLAERAVEQSPAAARAALAELRVDLDRALTDLRDLAHGLYPQALESDGLAGALAQAVQRAPLPTELDCDGAGRYRPELEAAVYFCCLEALQNAAKHAGPGTRANVRLSETDGAVRFEISDDGRGFEPAAVTNHRSGLQNMTDRIGALGGTLSISSAPGSGTIVTGMIPAGDP
jgi:signal transduction histidine kinase